MAAYNHVEFDSLCPACGTTQKLSMQTHVASSYSGDERGRFFDLTYRIGEAMRWWPADDPRHAAWREGGDPGHTSPVREACYATCTGCRAELCVVLEFDGPTPSRVVAVTLESQWPEGYVR